MDWNQIDYYYYQDPNQHSKVVSTICTSTTTTMATSTTTKSSSSSFLPKFWFGSGSRQPQPQQQAPLLQPLLPPTACNDLPTSFQPSQLHMVCTLLQHIFQL
ncbi:hypothetical protein ACA910_001745 [Epithemia clementina (nom. ined.)]